MWNCQSRERESASPCRIFPVRRGQVAGSGSAIGVGAQATVGMKASNFLEPGQVG